MKRIHNKVDFNTKKAYVKGNKKLDIQHFDSIKDLTNMIDFLNKELEDKRSSRFEEDTHHFLLSNWKYVKDHIINKMSSVK